MIDGQGTLRVDKALPVYPVGGTQTVTGTVTVTSTTANEGTAAVASNTTVTTAATTNATSVKATAGHVYSITVSNPTATPTFLKLYNKASAPTVGTDVPTAIIPIPASSFAVYEYGRLGDRYTTGIALAVTAAIAATDTAVAVAGVYIKVNYV